MKKAIGLVTMMLLLLSVFTYALGEDSSGVWMRKAYVDEFNIPTDSHYVTNSQPIAGTFNNSTKSDLPLTVELFMGIGDGIISVRLSEHGSDIVKNPALTSRIYDAVMLDPAGERHSFEGIISSGGDAIVFDEEASAAIVVALLGGGTVRFAMTEAACPTNKYVFSIEDTTGFADYFPYTLMREFSEGFVAVQKAGKWGFLNSEGTLAIPCKWDYAYSFNDGLALVFTGALDSYSHPNSGKYDFIDAKGNPVGPCQWDKALSFSEGLAAVQMDGKWGFLDPTGDLVIPCKWEDTRSFRDGVAPVKKDDKWGIINAAGELISPCEWDDISYYYNGFAEVTTKTFDNDGNPISHYGFIDTEGNVVVPCIWDYTAHLFSEGLIAVRKDEKWGFVDTSGNLIIPCIWDEAINFCDGLARVFEGETLYGYPFSGKYGYIDTTGRLVVPFLLKYADNFNEGLASIKFGGKWGFVNTSGEIVIPFKWDWARTFHNGLAPVGDQSNKLGLIDPDGNLVTPCEWDDILYYYGFWRVCKSDFSTPKYGVIDSSGNLVIPCEYNSIQYGDGYFTLLRDGELTILDSEYNRIL